MNDNAMQPADLLRARLEDMLALLDQHDLTLAAAWLTMAINAIPIECDHGESPPGVIGARRNERGLTS
ncbi:MAG: hypothetical protein EOO77_34575 [Oxalobacteraceae bacterium]|nr:MAG: hypothetical protein EOO77_34575 [Oxalobacteraceae bacterium]